jgi:hypothetical protein
MGARLQNLEPAYLRGSVVVLTAAQGHIRADGPGWPPTAETESGSSLYRTGALFRSLTIGEDGNVNQSIPGGIRVGSDLKTPEGDYSIARLMQYGTGPIKPKNAKLLVFEINGTKIFSKGTKGIPARRFLYWDQTTAQQVLGVFASYIMGRPFGGITPV